MTGKLLLDLRGSSVSVLAFSPDGKRLATAGSGIPGGEPARIWDAETGRNCSNCPPYIASILRASRFSQTVAQILTGNSNTPQSSGDPPWGRSLHVWDAVTGKRLQKIDLVGLTPRSIAIAADGKTVAVGGDVGLGPGADKPVLCLLNLLAPTKSVDLTGHTHRVESVAFSPDGKLLASASLDKTIRVWDVNKGTEIRKLVGHERCVASVVFSPTERCSHRVMAFLNTHLPIGIPLDL